MFPLPSGKKDILYIDRLAAELWVVMSPPGPQFLLVSPPLYVKVP